LDTTARYTRVATGMIAGIESPLDLARRTYSLSLFFNVFRPTVRMDAK
jgi:hypothetical protein